MYFAGIDKARFRRPVIPGDQLIVSVEVLSGPVVRHPDPGARRGSRDSSRPRRR